MADSTTTTYSLIKVEVGGSTDTWGGKWNANADAIDAALTALALLNGTRPFTGVVQFAAASGFNFGGATGFALEVNGTDLEFSFNGTVIATLSSIGTFTAIDIVADDTL